MSLTENRLHEAQSSLANYCRTGIYQEIAGVDSKRVKQYRRLVYNIIDDSLRSAYPLTYKLFEKEEWDSLVNEFFSSHPCSSPQIWTMPKEFYEYVLETDHPFIKKYPFLPELLKMEWLEIELFMMEDEDISYQKENIKGKENLLINPEHRLEHFNYPVHLKTANTIQESDKGNYFLVMHRHPDNGKVIFTDLSVFYARILEHLSEEAYESEEVIQLTAAEFRLADDPLIYSNSRKFIDHAIEKRLLLTFY